MKEKGLRTNYESFEQNY